jgi:hypothetical protein
MFGNFRNGWKSHAGNISHQGASFQDRIVFVAAWNYKSGPGISISPYDLFFL